MNNKRIIVTGAAGFIGANLCMELFRKNEGVHVIGIDNMNDYYDVSIKEWRLAEVEKFAAESAGSTWEYKVSGTSEHFVNSQITRKKMMTNKGRGIKGYI